MEFIILTFYSEVELIYSKKKYSYWTEELPELSSNQVLRKAYCKDLKLFSFIQLGNKDLLIPIQPNECRNALNNGKDTVSIVPSKNPLHRGNITGVTLLALQNNVDLSSTPLDFSLEVKIENLLVFSDPIENKKKKIKSNLMKNQIEINNVLHDLTTEEALLVEYLVDNDITTKEKIVPGKQIFAYLIGIRQDLRFKSFGNSIENLFNDRSDKKGEFLLNAIFKTHSRKKYLNLDAL